MEQVQARFAPHEVDGLVVGYAVEPAFEFAAIEQSLVPAPEQLDEDVLDDVLGGRGAVHNTRRIAQKGCFVSGHNRLHLSCAVLRTVGFACPHLTHSRPSIFAFFSLETFVTWLFFLLFMKKAGCVSSVGWCVGGFGGASASLALSSRAQRSVVEGSRELETTPDVIASLEIPRLRSAALGMTGRS